jgi:hypothetical protein
MSTTNVYFTQGTRNEQYLIEDLIIESLRIYGQEVMYIPRTLVSKDEILGEDRLSQFKSAFPIEMYFENVDSFGGQGAFIQKFGLMVEQSATLVVARRRWDQMVGRYGATTLPNRPNEGDLIYFPLSKGLFEIKFVQHQDPFYQLGKLYVYKLQVELFQYASEAIDTGIAAVDAFETLKTFNTNATRSAFGVVKSITMTNNGSGYTSAPEVAFVSSSGYGATATAVLGDGSEELATALENYTNYQIMFDDAFSQLTEVSGYPWGITLPANQTTYNTLIQLPHNTTSISGVMNAVNIAYTLRNAYFDLQAAQAVSTAGKVIRVDITNGGSGYQTPPSISFIGGGGANAAATSTIEVDIDKPSSFGDNNKFKDESVDVINFDESNPFGEINRA